MTGPTWRGRDDRGTVLVLAIGLVTVVLVGLVVMVSAGATFLQRRALVSLADAAALAGAQAIDLDQYYREGATPATALDGAAVDRRVRDHLRRFGPEVPAGMAIELVASDGHHVRVVLSAPLRLPFLEEMGDARIEVSSDAELAYRESRG